MVNLFGSATPLRRLSVVAVMATVLFVAPAAFAGNLVNNGSFENNGGIGELAGGITSLSGWSVGSTTDGSPAPFAFVVDSTADSQGFPSVYSPPNIKVWGPSTGVNNGFGSSPDGGAFLGVDGAYATAPVFQSVSGLTIGDQYTLSFYYAGAQFTDAVGSTTQGWQVSFGADTVSTPDLSVVSQGFSGWQTFTHTFTASAASETLSFLAKGTPSGLPPFVLLDGVNLATATAPVPEPSTLALVTLGLAGAGFTRRFRRSRGDKAAA